MFWDNLVICQIMIGWWQKWSHMFGIELISPEWSSLIWAWFRRLPCILLYEVNSSNPFPGHDEGFAELERASSDVITARTAATSGPGLVSADHRQVLDEARKSGKVPDLRDVPPGIELHPGGGQPPAHGILRRQDSTSLQGGSGYQYLKCIVEISGPSSGLDLYHASTWSYNNIFSADFRYAWMHDF